MMATLILWQQTTVSDVSDKVAEKMGYGNGVKIIWQRVSSVLFPMLPIIL